MKLKFSKDLLKITFERDERFAGRKMEVGIKTFTRPIDRYKWYRAYPSSMRWQKPYENEEVDDETRDFVVDKLLQKEEEIQIKYEPSHCLKSSEHSKCHKWQTQQEKIRWFDADRGDIAYTSGYCVFCGATSDSIIVGYENNKDELNNRYSIEAFNNGEFGNCRCDSYYLYDRKCIIDGFFYRPIDIDIRTIEFDAKITAILNIEKRDVPKELEKRGIPYVKGERRITVVNNILDMAVILVIIATIAGILRLLFLTWLR
jgi:hypothetical protein